MAVPAIPVAPLVSDLPLYERISPRRRLMGYTRAIHGECTCDWCGLGIEFTIAIADEMHRRIPDGWELGIFEGARTELTCPHCTKEAHAAVGQVRALVKSANLR